jgi:hypothetical protein
MYSDVLPAACLELNSIIRIHQNTWFSNDSLGAHVFWCIRIRRFSWKLVASNTSEYMRVQTIRRKPCILVYSHVLLCISTYRRNIKEGQELSASFFASWGKNEFEFKPHENRFENYEKLKNQEYIVYFPKNRVSPRCQLNLSALVLFY